MVLFQFSIAILFLSITSVKTYSVPYKNIQLAFSITPKLIYTSESNPAFSGYSYTTQDFNGGESNVVFTIGADSTNRLKNEMDSMKMSGYSQRDKNQDNIISSGQQFESERAEENSKNQDLDSNIKIFNEEKKYTKNSETDNNLIEHQTNFQQISLMEVPYPALGENLQKLHLPVFPRYQISSNVIQSQYYPYNPYTRLELPLHNFDFYNPVPLFYQAATIIPDTNSKPALTVENMKASVEPHIAKSLQINTTNSEPSSVKSNIVKSRINQESTTNGIEQASSQSAISMNEFESTTISEKVKEKIPTNKTTETSQISTEQTTMDNKANSTELASTEMNSLKKSSTTT